MKRFLLFAFTFIISACASQQMTEETDCCLAMNVTLPVQTETQTPIPTPNQTQNAKLDEYFAFQTLVAQFPSICNSDTPYQFSPNGLWGIATCEIDNKSAITISSRETKVLWKIFYTDYVPRQGIIGEGNMAILHWSKDGNYVFFNTYSTGSGGECFSMRGWQEGFGLFRLDLQTGEVTEILPVFKDRYTYYNFSISPTDRRLVYDLFLGNLKILDITTGKSIDVINLKDFHDGGGYIWSQDGLRFIYSTVIYSTGYKKQDFTVRLVDAKTGIEQIILESSQDCLHVVEWTDTNIIKIQKNYDESSIEFDLNTNAIISEIPITP